jgi:hypothetical protein
MHHIGRIERYDGYRAVQWPNTEILISMNTIK